MPNDRHRQKARAARMIERNHYMQGYSAAVQRINVAIHDLRDAIIEDVLPLLCDAIRDFFASLSPELVDVVRCLGRCNDDERNQTD